jgi:hypothetical protein
MKNIFYILNAAAAVTSNATRTTHINNNIAQHFAMESQMTENAMLESYRKQTTEHPLQKILEGKELPPNLEKVKKILDERPILNITALALVDLLRISINPKSETPNPPVEGDIVYHATSSPAEFLHFILTLGFMSDKTTTEQAEEMAKKIFDKMKSFHKINHDSPIYPTKKLDQVKDEIREMHTLLKDKIFNYFPEVLSKTYVDFMRAIPTLSDADLNALSAHTSNSTLKVLELSAILSKNDPVFQAIACFIICINEKPISVKEIKAIYATLPPNTSLENFMIMLLDDKTFSNSINIYPIDDSLKEYEKNLVDYIVLSTEYRSILFGLKTLGQIYNNPRIAEHLCQPPHYKKLSTFNEQQLEKLASFIADLPVTEASPIWGTVINNKNKDIINYINSM